MSAPRKWELAPIGTVPPGIAQPFAVVIDAGDPEWKDEAGRRALVEQLLSAGCRYFVCYGGESESLHDQIDDLVVAIAAAGVTTTYHDDESVEDVISFVRVVAAEQAAAVLLWFRDPTPWRASVS
jgi:hypothetical protein